ncbi:transmembrane anchor protein [Nitrincola iocasae]|uniref:Transmembrane anchor protein n=1 Tax=Nitrincola iocasae TaxID=2614693 RepID=A0A5J6LBV5_9GAMM|nr:transmembrane anchor protein [Nitrincola iocasae]QEW06013.1 transmembrane anchor protein [Nitrincola iocasae]
MYNTDIPSRAELPTTQQLIRSTFIALITALVILVTVILPSEYAVDPTGVGRWLGLTEMGEIKQQLAAEAEADALYLAQENTGKTTSFDVADAHAELNVVEEVAVEEIVAEPIVTPSVMEYSAENVQSEVIFEEEALVWRDTVEIILTPGQGTEIKLVMAEGSTARFSWEGVEGPLNYDTHGDGGGRSISYEKGRGVQQDEGELTAAFTGNHGWFFRNRTSENVTLILRTAGDYEEVKRVL